MGGEGKKTDIADKASINGGFSLGLTEIFRSHPLPYHSVIVGLHCCTEKRLQKHIGTPLSAPEASAAAASTTFSGVSPPLFCLCNPLPLCPAPPVGNHFS